MNYNHDAEVIVYNYKTRATETSSFGGISLPGGNDPLATDTISIKEAIINITLTKTKTQPQGSFMITLKAS